MLTKILVPLDGSSLAEQALMPATELALTTGAHVLLVRVARSHTLAGVDPRERMGGAIAEAEAYLAGVARVLGERGITTETSVPYGAAADGIRDEARLRGADLIVMASHGRTAAGALVFGSVAEAVVAGSPVPVLVEHGAAPIAHAPLNEGTPLLVVPLDGSSYGEQALPSAISLARAVRGDLMLVRVEASYMPGDAALEYLSAVVARIQAGHPTLRVRAEVLFGTPTEAIADAAGRRGAAFIVLSTHGHGALRRALTGSVADRLVQTSRTPVVLVHPARDPDAPAPAPELALSAG